MKRLFALTRSLVAALMLSLVFAALFNFALGPAYALYNDQTKKYLPRYYNGQIVQYYRFTLNWNDPNISTGQVFGALGCNAYILSIDADVTTAFNAATTNSVSIGVTSASANEIVAGGTSSGTNIVAGSTGINHLTTAAGLGVIVTGNTSDQINNGPVPCYVPLYAKYAQTGTAATAGSVTVVIAYVPNNDM